MLIPNSCQLPLKNVEINPSKFSQSMLLNFYAPNAGSMGSKRRAGIDGDAKHNFPYLFTK